MAIFCHFSNAIIYVRNTSPSGQLNTVTAAKSFDRLMLAPKPSADLFCPHTLACHPQHLVNIGPKASVVNCVETVLHASGLNETYQCPVFTGLAVIVDKPYKAAPAKRLSDPFSFIIIKHWRQPL